MVGGLDVGSAPHMSSASAVCAQGAVVMCGTTSAVAHTHHTRLGRTYHLGPAVCCTVQLGVGAILLPQGGPRRTALHCPRCRARLMK